VSHLDTRIIVSDRGDAQRRVDHVLVRRLPEDDGASRSQVQQWIRNGRLRVDGVVVSRPSMRVRPGQRLELTQPARQRRRVAAQDIQLRVLYEDDWLLAVDKPAGMLAHPTSRQPDGTLVNALLAFDALERVEGRGPRLVHRLDRDTSGVVLVAKSAAVHAALARALAKRAIDKVYLAIVLGRPPVARDRIDLRIRRDPETGRLAASKREGRPCSTQYEVLAEARHGVATIALIRCRLLTGRMHQIRVHLSAIGLPLVGDPLYGPAPRARALAALPGMVRDFPRQALHAWQLACTHPMTGAQVSLSASLPDDFQALAHACGLPLPEAPSFIVG
jgi:23S rRNA pseudouridine1911/1915/1917 synthase